MSTTDTFTSMCFEHPINQKNAITNGKNLSEANEKKNQKKKKEDNCDGITNNNNNNENRNNKNKTNVYILGDSMVKKLNGYLLTREIRHKHLVKVRSFSGAKISCMTDHVKPTLRDINPDHIVLHADTNDLRTENTASQIVKAAKDLATSLKNDGNTVTVSGIVAKLDELSNKANEVNRRLALKCFQDSVLIETGLSDFDKMSTTVMKMYYTKQRPSIVRYRKFENFCNDSFMKDIELLLSKLCNQENVPFKIL